MPWLYTPISIRLLPQHSKWPELSCSGIYLVSAENGTVTDLCLTIFHIPINEIQKRYKVYVCAPQLAAQDDVEWSGAQISRSAPLLMSRDSLRDRFQSFKSNGFNMIPSDTTSHGFSGLNVAVLSCKPFFSETNRPNFENFSIGSAGPSAQIWFRSFPFSFTSSRLFADFRSSGTINATLKNENNIDAFLSDTKYLENMIGGIAVNETGASVGLLAGTLRKGNGDGELSVIISWQRLVALLRMKNSSSKSFMKLENSWPKPELAPLSGTGMVTEHHNSSSEIKKRSPLLQASKSVLPMVLTRGEDRFMWGSCILLNSKTLVTNHHIVSILEESNSVQCHVLADKTVTLSEKDRVVVPFDGLDLAFIVLCPESQARFSGIKPVKMTLSQYVSRSSPVYSVGYGLFLDQENVEPLLSRGFISRKVQMSPFPGCAKIPCLVAASASCWNGSSGGGLFTESGSLTGVICSNAQVFLPSLNGEVQTKTEKVPSACFCIPLELILECYRLKVENNAAVELDAKVVKAWRLEKYHEDVFERSLKL